MGTTKRRTETTREVQAELRAFALLLSTIHVRLVELMPIIEQQPAFKENDRASKAGDDDRFTVEWSIHGLKGTDLEALEEVSRHVREDGERTEADAARREEKHRKERVVRERRYARQDAIREKARQKARKRNAAAVASINASVDRITATLRETSEILARKSGASRAACVRS